MDGLIIFKLQDQVVILAEDFLEPHVLLLETAEDARPSTEETHIGKHPRQLDS